MNHITNRIQHLDPKLTIEQALEIQNLFEEWHAVDTSEVSQKTIDVALNESITMFKMGVNAYWEWQKFLMGIGA